MLDWYLSLERSQAESFAHVAGIAIVSAAILLMVLIVQWRRLNERQFQIQQAMQRTELETSLKHELLQHGLSADEIKQVIEATSADIAGSF